MNSTESNPIDVARKAVFNWAVDAETQQDLDALNRLVDRHEAHISWKQLARKKIKSEYGSYASVASDIGRLAVHAYLTPDQKRTKREISEVASEAAKLARRLIHLITHNESLRNIGSELCPSIEQAALDRLLNGLISQAVKAQSKVNNNTVETWFSNEIEQELDIVQAREYPQHKDMTTIHAYHELRDTQMSDDGFIERLKLFAEFSDESASFDPRVPRPNSDNADMHHFGNQLCLKLNYHYGSPNCEIAAGFISAVFDTSVDAETVKKWWQRARDNSD